MHLLKKMKVRHEDVISNPSLSQGYYWWTSSSQLNRIPPHLLSKRFWCIEFPSKLKMELIFNEVELFPDPSDQKAQVFFMFWIIFLQIYHQRCILCKDVSTINYYIHMPTFRIKCSMKEFLEVQIIAIWMSAFKLVNYRSRVSSTRGEYFFLLKWCGIGLDNFNILDVNLDLSFTFFWNHHYLSEIFKTN